jgi:hypothetical protein
VNPKALPQRTVRTEGNQAVDGPLLSKSVPGCEAWPRLDLEKLLTKEGIAAVWRGEPRAFEDNVDGALIAT